MCSGGGIKLRIEIDSMTMRCGSMIRMRGRINVWRKRAFNRVNNAGIPDEVALESYYDELEI